MWIERYQVDFLWRAQRLVVEVDGFDTHSSRASFEADRRRDAYLMTKGLEVLRITWWQLTEEPEATLAVIAGRLARAE
jgi:very-short-patch-repair endonuclease